MNEEIVVKIGGSTDGLATALRGVKGMVEHAGESIKDSFKDFGKGIGEHLTEALTVGAIVAEFEHLGEKVVEIKREAATLNVSTDFVQSLNSVGKVAGVGAEAIEKMMDNFLKGLPAGSDVEKQLYAFADRLKEIQDPAERARMVVEAFGDKAIKLVPILSHGSDGIKKMSSEFAKLSDAEIEAIEHGHHAQDELGAWWDQMFAKWIYGYSLFVKTSKNFYTDLIGNLTSGKNPFAAALEATLDQMNDDDADAANTQRMQTQIAQIQAVKQAQDQAYQEDMDAFDRYQNKKDEIEFKKLTPKQQVVRLENKEDALWNQGLMADNEADAYDILTEIEEVHQKILDLKKNINAEDEKNKIKLDAQAQAANALLQQIVVIEALKAAGGGDQETQENGANNFPTLQEVANSGTWSRHQGSGRMVFTPGPFAKEGQDIQRWQQEQARDRAMGDPQAAEALKPKINAAMEDLRSNGVLPPSEVMKAMDEKLAALVKKFDDLTRSSPDGKSALSVAGSDD